MTVWFGRGILAALAVGAILLGGATPSDAQMKMMAGDAIKERQDLMHKNGGALKTVALYLKQNKGSAADVAASARTVAANLATFATLFPRGTSMNDSVAKNRAKPEIWSMSGDFQTSALKAIQLAWNLADAAASGNKGAIGTAMGVLGKEGCGGCHRVYRGPKQ